MDKTKPEEKTSSPYDFFRSTAHEIVSQDAAFQLLRPGESLSDILAKTAIPDQDYFNRVVQCVAKLEDSELGEDAEPPYDAGINLVKNLLNGLNSLHARSRAEFIQGLSRVFAPGYFELLQTGKMTASLKSKKHAGIFKGKEEKDEESQ